MQADPDQHHLLIIGPPRSGTTLVTAMLSAHRDIALLSEDKSGNWRRLLSKKVIGTKLTLPNQIELKRRHGERVTSAVRISVLKQLRRLGFNVPWYRSGRSIISIEAFLKMPNAHVIGTIRDPGNVIRSIHERGQQPKREATRRWSRAVRILHEIKTAAPDRVTIIDFSDLLRQPEAILRQLEAQLDVRHDPATLNGYTPNYGLKTIDASKAEHAALDPASQPDSDTMALYRDLLTKTLRPSSEAASESSQTIDPAADSSFVLQPSH